jgi:hypothetical protein
MGVFITIPILASESSGRMHQRSRSGDFRRRIGVIGRRRRMVRSDGEIPGIDTIENACTGRLSTSSPEMPGVPVEIDFNKHIDGDANDSLPSDKSSGNTFFSLNSSSESSSSEGESSEESSETSSGADYTQEAQHDPFTFAVQQEEKAQGALRVIANDLSKSKLVGPRLRLKQWAKGQRARLKLAFMLQEAVADRNHATDQKERAEKQNKQMRKILANCSERFEQVRRENDELKRRLEEEFEMDGASDES